MPEPLTTGRQRRSVSNMVVFCTFLLPSVVSSTLSGVLMVARGKTPRLLHSKIGYYPTFRVCAAALSCRPQRPHCCAPMHLFNRRRRRAPALSDSTSMAPTPERRPPSKIGLRSGVATSAMICSPIEHPSKLQFQLAKNFTRIIVDYNLRVIYYYSAIQIRKNCLIIPAF